MTCRFIIIIIIIELLLQLSLHGTAQKMAISVVGLKDESRNRDVQNMREEIKQLCKMFVTLIFVWRELCTSVFIVDRFILMIMITNKQQHQQQRHKMVT